MLHPKKLLLLGQAPKLKLIAQRQTMKSTLKTGSISHNEELDRVGAGAQPLQWLLIFQQKKPRFLESQIASSLNSLRIANSLNYTNELCLK